MKLNATCLVALAATLPVPTGACWAEPVEQWIPLSVGSRWVYESSGVGHLKLGAIDHSAEITEEVTVSVEDRLELDPSVWVVETQTRAQTALGSATQAIRIDHLSYSEGALLWHGNGLKQEGQFIPMDYFAEYKPPHVLLKMPLEEGASWQVGISSTQDGSEVRTAQILGWESVTTPAGDFPRCLKLRYRSAGTLEGTTKSGTALEERTEWYARGVGLVKREQNAEAHGRGPDGIEVLTSRTATYLLRSYKLLDD